MRAYDRDKSNGYVLVTVLWFLAVLSAIAVSVLHFSNAGTRASRVLVGQARAEALSDGLTRLISAELVDPSQPPDTWRLFGSPKRCHYSDAKVEFDVTDISGLVDINFASPELLAALLRGGGATRERAHVIAAAIIDFRDPDDRPTANGAEREAYREAGRSYLPSNRSFQVVGELDQVLGMTPILFDNIRPFITVHSRFPTLDPLQAPQRLVKLLREASKDLGPDDKGDQFFQWVRRLDPPTYSVRVSVETRERAHFTRLAIVETEPRSPLKHVYREWSLGARTEFDDLPLRVGCMQYFSVQK